MTGIEELEQILALLDSVMPPGPDPEAHRQMVLISAAPTVLQRAAQLVGENKFDVATDLVVSGSALISEAHGKFMQDRIKDGDSLEAQLQRMREGRSNTRIVRTHRNSNNLQAEELVELGVIDDESEIEDPNHRDARDFKFCGFVGHYPTCSECEDEVASVVTFFGVEVDGHSVIGTSLCEEHMKRLVDGLHAAPEMHLVAQILFVRGDEEEEDDDDEDDDPDTAHDPSQQAI